MSQDTDSKPDAGDERLADHLSGSLPPRERAALEAELLGDPEASEALYAQLSLEAAIAARGERARAARRWRRGLLVGLPLAAAIALLWLGPAWQEQLAGPTAPRLRGESGQARGLEPTGVQSLPPTRFRWTAHAQAVRYRFELYDVEARLRYSAVLGDTLLALPAELPPPAAGFWRVVPVDAAGRELDAGAPLHFGPATPAP